MKKKKQVIVKQKNSVLGKPGTLLNVSNGYAFNYLIPKGIVTLATDKAVRHLSMLKEIERKSAETSKTQAILMQKSLEQISKISIKKNVGENQQIFGSVSEKEIITQIMSYTGQKIEKKQIVLPDIKEIGIYDIKINILHDISVSLKLQIIPENI
uniref:ribosomal protein L9 n=1 Tax=Gloiopeltis furcata TaxID=42017 RepID=UPI0028D79F13|nr:ribosomal protein L9 [Gloiopeltis furcata]WMP13964.1 ribosomal protein L9 [Gloiopeltis furcata]